MNHMKSSATKDFKIVRKFNAPREDVFNAFAEADALNEWWGPAETSNSVISLDFIQGGIFHYRMEKDGQINYGRFLFGRILPHHLLEFTNSFADENANVIAAPFNISLPKAIFYSLSFTDLGDKTILTLIGKPIEASKEEIEGFRAINESMQQGFGGTFDRLADYLNNTQNSTKNL
jgi:uncharacterized protein YndB with AHSA1/START domain